MSQNLPSILEAARQLPPEEQRQLAEQLLKESHATETGGDPAYSIPDLAKEIGPGKLALQPGQHRYGSTEMGAGDLAEVDPKDEAAFRWINEHGGQYAGQWLALDGDRLLAHGPDLSEVAAVARARGVRFPLLHLVEPRRDHPFIRS